MDKLGMYKQRAIIQLISTLLITLTIISLIEIYWFSIGIFSYILIAIILLFRFSASRHTIQTLKTEQEEMQTKEDNNRYNQQMYDHFIETISHNSSHFPLVLYNENIKLQFVNNDERMIILNSLKDYLRTNYKVDFDSLHHLINPYINLIENIRKIDNSLQEKANIRLLQDLRMEEIITENLKTLHHYHRTLQDKGKKFVNDDHSIRLGLEGEKRVNEELALYDDILINLPNVRFEVQGASVETDNFVLSPFGIFAIEVKNLGSSGNFKIKIEKDGRWLKVFKNSSEVMKNITSQTYRHIGLKQKLINKELNKLGYSEYIQIKPLIVIANENVEIINESDVPVVRTSNIYHHISQFPKELDLETLSSIEKIAKENTLPPKEYEIENIMEYIKNTNDYLQSNLKGYFHLYEELTKLENQIK